MNRIYKVIWSKVKNQYVVVSELAHSNGKQSRTGKKSLRSRIAALVVCGAIAAFGVYGAMPTQQAFADGATTTQGQYIAIGGAVYTDADNYRRGEYNPQTTYYKYFTDASGTSHRYIYTVVGDNAYWVRDGYSIEVVSDERFTGAQTDNVIRTYKGAGADDDGLVQSYQNEIRDANIGTLNGETLNVSNTNMYGGAVNTGTYLVTMNNEFMIDPYGTGNYINGRSYWTAENLVYNSQTGLYSYNGEVVSTSDLYVINGQVGVFVVDGKLYTDSVYGRNNEILMTAKDDNGNYVSYWGAEIVDPNATIGDMTISTLQEKFDVVNSNIEKIHKDDIKEIQVGASENGNGGTIGLLTNGDFDENGNPTGDGASIPGTITITSIGGTDGKDVQVQFSNTTTDADGETQTNSFTVNAGSKVVANATEGTDSGTLSSVSINGNVYTLPTGTTYTKGNGIAISDENVISVDLAKDSEQNNISGLHFDENGGLANNLKVTADTSEGTHSDGGNWTITDTAQANEIFKNTTLSSVSNTEIDNGEEGDNRVVYGNNYTISDTDGNTVTLKDVASASKLEDVDTRVTNVENDTITGGSISDSGKISLTQQDGTSLTLDNAIHDYALVDKEGGYSVENNSVTLNVQDQYGNGTDSTVTINGIASTADVAAAKTEVKAGTNIASIGTSTDETDKHTIYTINAEGAKVSADSNFIVTPKTDEVTNITDYNIGLANTVTIGSGENAKPVKIDGVNGEVTGLTNTTLDVTGFATSNRAATEEQLKAAMEEFEGNNYTGWTVSANGQNGSTVASGKTVDFSGVTVGEGDDATSNITVTKTTDDDGNTQLAFDLSDELNVTNITASGSITANNMYVTTTDGTNNNSVVNVGYFNANEKHIMPTTGDGSYVAADDGTVTLSYADGNGNEIEGMTAKITGLASDKELSDAAAKATTEVVAGTNISVSKDTETAQDGHTIYTVDLDDNVYLGGDNTAENNNISLDGTNGVIEVGSTIALDGRDGTAVIGGVNITTTYDETTGKPSSIISGLSNTTWDDTVKDAVAASVEGDNKTEASKAATQAQLLAATDELSDNIGELDDFAVKYDKNNDGTPNYSSVTLAGENGTKITNLADGTISADSTDAVNGSQLYSVQQEAEKHTEITVNGGVSAPTDGSYTNDGEGHLDGNLLLRQTEGNDGQTVYDLKLNPDITLQSEDTNPETQDNRVELSGSNGTIMATTDYNDMSATTTINGGNVYVGSSVTVGDTVKITDTDITGLSNTTWDGTTDDVSRAATEGQLKDVSDTVNAGWIATDNNGNEITVNPEDNTLNFSGDRNIGVTANEETGSIDVTLSDDIVLGGADGSTSRVEIGGTNGTIMATKDVNNMSATTTIDGGTIYAGNAVIVGTPNSNEVTISEEDITGLTNTTWDGTTDDVSRAATEGQLKDVSDTVNAGWIATDNNGNEITVNPEDNTLNFSGDRNIGVTANEETGSIDVTLSDDIVLGGADGSTSRVEIGGTNGTIMATKDANDMSATTTIDGGTIYAGNSIIVGTPNSNEVTISEEDITGLTNTTWDGTTDDVSRAATEGQLKDVSDTVNAGWIATDNNGNEITVNPEDNTLNFSGDRNISVTANEETGSIDVALSDDIVLGGADGSTSRVEIGGTNGTIMITKDANNMGATTTIDGGNIYAGSSVIVGTPNSNEVTISEEDITGLTNTTWNPNGTYNSGRAATEEQLSAVADWTEEQINNSGWTVSTNGEETTKVNNGDTVDFSNTDGNILIDQENGNLVFDLNDELAIGNNITLNGNTGDAVFGTINVSGSSGTISGLTNTTWDPNNIVSGQAATEDQLQQAISSVKDEVTSNDQHLVANPEGGNYSVENNQVDLKVQNGYNEDGTPNYSTITIDNIAQASDIGDISTINDDLKNKDEDGNSIDTSVVDAINNLDDKVGSGDFTGTTNITNPSDTTITDAIKDLDSAISNATTEAGKHSTVTGDNKNITVTETPYEDKGTNYEVSLNPDLEVDTVTASGNINAGSFTSGDITINSGSSGLVSGLHNTEWNWSKYDEGGYSSSSNAATEAQLSSAMEGAVQYDRVTDENGNITIDKTNITLNKGGDSVTIHNVAGGRVEQGSTDAVNGDQLYQVQQGVNNNANAINNMNNRVSSLSNRIDKVGAGAAALAALHPLDFDPDDKLSFAAGYGNYAGENAVAVGAFYQPNEDTMFSVGGTFGNDENMVNAGVSFKLGQKNNVSRSRVSMAKELVALRDEVAQLKALMAHSGILPADGQLDTSDLFPDIPENHWAYEYVHELAKLGIVEGYPDGNFDGDRMMTRYEFAAMVYRAMQKGVNVDKRMLTEFEPELKLIRVDVVAKDRNGNPTIERVRVNEEATQQA